MLHTGLCVLRGGWTWGWQQSRYATFLWELLARGGSHKAVLGSYSNTELFTGGGYGAIKIIRARAEMMAVSDRQMKCYQNRIMML